MHFCTHEKNTKYKRGIDRGKLFKLGIKFGNFNAFNLAYRTLRSGNFLKDVIHDFYLQLIGRITKNQINSLVLFGPSFVEDVSYGVSVGFVDADVGALSAVYPLLYAVIIVGWDAGALVELAFGPVSRHISPLVCSVL